VTAVVFPLHQTEKRRIAAVEIPPLYSTGVSVAKPNYQYEKRQRDLAKKKKQDEKRRAKLEKKNQPPKTDAEPISQ
jgi:hypothetical protein